MRRAGSHGHGQRAQFLLEDLKLIQQVRLRSLCADGRQHNDFGRFWRRELPVRNVAMVLRCFGKPGEGSNVGGSRTNTPSVPSNACCMLVDRDVGECDFAALLRPNPRPLLHRERRRGRHAGATQTRKQHPPAL